jgi:hypothetical protein
MGKLEFGTECKYFGEPKEFTGRLLVAYNNTDQTFGMRQIREDIDSGKSEYMPIIIVRQNDNGMRKPILIERFFTENTGIIISYGTNFGPDFDKTPNSPPSHLEILAQEFSTDKLPGFSVIIASRALLLVHRYNYYDRFRNLNYFPVVKLKNTGQPATIEYKDEELLK